MRTDDYQNHRLNVSKIVGGHVHSELNRQHRKWGDQYHSDTYWLGIIMEEIGEVAKAVIEHQPEQVKEEIAHAVACLTQLYACYIGPEDARDLLRMAGAPEEVIR